MRKPTTMRFDDITYQRLEEIKTELHMTQTEALEEAIRLLHKEQVEQKPAVLRWVDIDALPGRPGEVEWTEVDCLECGQPMKSPWKALMSDGTWSMTVCHRCATSD